MHRTLICFDYGKKRIGVAVGQELTRTANPLETINAAGGEPDWRAISRIVNEWQPDAFVIGLPVNDDGSEHKVTLLVKEFARQLDEKFSLPHYFIDERLSSSEAESMIENKQAIRRDKGLVDRIAAKLILQSWFSQA